jgi:hypothetical protein
MDFIASSAANRKRATLSQLRELGSVRLEVGLARDLDIMYPSLLR